MLFKNATIYTMEQDPFVGDFKIDKGVFTEVGTNLSASEGEDVQDLNGLYVFPGLVESHCHLGMEETAISLLSSASSQVKLGSLQQARKQALNILAHISGLRQNCGIDYGERHIKHTRYCTSYQSLARAGRTDHDDIALFNVYVIVILGLG